MRDLRTIIDETLNTKRAGGVTFSAPDVAISAVEAMTPEERHAQLVGMATAAAHRRMMQAIKAEAKADTRQGLLALPTFGLVSPWVKVEGGILPIKQASFEQHRESVRSKERKIKEMSYPRWSPERMKTEKAVLAQEQKLDQKLAPLTAGDKEMGMGQAMEMFQERMETPSTQAKIKGGKAGGRGRKRPTKNQ